MLITNAFSLNMLCDLLGPWIISVIPLKEENVKDILRRQGIDSAVGHVDTAAVFSTTLGVEIPMIRKTVALNKGDAVIVGQYRGPRMAEGVKELPAGSTIEWVLVTVA